VSHAGFYKIGQAFSDSGAAANTAEAFERAMYDVPTMRRLISVARKQPKDFQNMAALAAMPTANEAIQGEPQ